MNDEAAVDLPALLDTEARLPTRYARLRRKHACWPACSRTRSSTPAGRPPRSRTPRSRCIHTDRQVYGRLDHLIFPVARVAWPNALHTVTITTVVSATSGGRQAALFPVGTRSCPRDAHETGTETPGRHWHRAEPAIHSKDNEYGLPRGRGNKGDLGVCRPRRWPRHVYARAHSSRHRRTGE